MKTIIILLDILALVSALLAAFFWYRACRRNTRRVDLDEEFDFHDHNRLVVAINRGNMLNRRAAIASAVSAGCLAAKLAADLVFQLFFS